MKIKHLLWTFLVILFAFLTFKFFIFSTNKAEKKISDDYYFEASKRFYKIFTVRIPEKLDFAGENVPLEKFYVREGLDRELLVNSFWHSNTLLMFKRAHRFLPVIDSILKANQIPTDFKYLAMIESGLENVISPAGAAGYWQFMKATAQKYGLEVNNEVDERYHLEKSTEAACKYLKDAYKKFNNWTLAAASYNMGQDGLYEVLQTQKMNNFYDLFLNKETQRYIYRILAIKIIYESPVSYGFYLRTHDFYPPIPTYTVTVDSAVSDWAEFALKNNSNYRILKELNPWILKYSLTNKDRKKYSVKFPIKGFEYYSNLIKIIPTDDKLFHDTLKIDAIR